MLQMPGAALKGLSGWVRMSEQQPAGQHSNGVDVLSYCCCYYSPSTGVTGMDSKKQPHRRLGIKDGVT